MKYSSIPLAQAVVTQCKNEQLKHIVISPGSRNAPLTLSFTSDSYFSCYSVVDERSAGFFALGMAQQLKEPVALVCTSGSALLNYYPAISEAYYSQIPLVVLSADRPDYLIDRGDGQTIRQKEVFANHIGFQAHLKQDVTHAFNKVKKYKENAPQTIEAAHIEQEVIHRENTTTLKKALSFAKETREPIHLNLPFEEPLYETVELSVEQLLKTSQEGIRDASLKKSSLVNELGPTTAVILPKSLKKALNSARKVMLLIGVLEPHSFDRKTLEILSNESILVFTETTSNLLGEEFVNSIDSLIAPIEKAANKETLFSALQPDLLITMGGAIVSKKIKSFLRNFQPKSHWHVGNEKAFDTYFCLEKHLKMPVASFIEIIKGETQSSSYKSLWTKAYKELEILAQEYTHSAPFSDLSVHHTIVEAMPESMLVHYSNSTAIRYSQLFPPKTEISIYCNRGTSGIDGSVSTAVGASWISESPTILVTGDLSFFYDSNAFWNRYIKSNFRVLLLNNGGGGIFRILPTGSSSEAFETFFETPHQLHAKSFCEVYGLSYVSACDEASLKQALKQFFEPSEKALVLEVFTPRKTNDLVLKAYFEFLSTYLFSME